ncbi:hypothetical protein PIB30_034305 [Stylosanthes scabra]|uniref:Ubiquitin-like protease family profile domain-containing protein n=1 Tax=Stylosanthes scabra TaxID=79078 RepID=A0ABU6RD13_9FABA|nr:hypothetical protein [Stylosanthes scabra]
MADKGKKQDEEGASKMATSVAELDLVNVSPRGLKLRMLCVCRDIPRLNPEDLHGDGNASVKVYNSFREHLLERDASNRAFMQANRRHLKLLSDAITAQEKLSNLIWGQHEELRKAFEEEKELARKGILYSIERSGGYTLLDNQPTRGKTWKAHPLTVLALLESKGLRRLDFDGNETENDGANAVAGDADKNDEVGKIKFGYIGSLHFPRRLKVSFRPPPGMQFFITEIALGAYAFSKSMEKTEILFQRDDLSLDRKTLWSLRPKKAVPREILDAVATMMTDESSDAIWWLPTTFGPIALNPTGYCKATLDFITTRYMGYVDETHKIFIALSCEDHWFLLVVDLRNKKLVYLDSLKDVNARDQRVKIIDFVPNRSGTAYWMQMANLWSDYNSEVVNSTHCYRLATSLLMARANVKRDEVTLAAMRYYEGRDGSREKELDISSDSSSSTKPNVPVDVDSDSVEF